MIFRKEKNKGEGVEEEVDEDEVAAVQQGAKVGTTRRDGASQLASCHHGRSTRIVTHESVNTSRNVVG